MTSSQDRLQVNVIIQGKREKVFEAWTKPELLKKWFCPENFRNGPVEADVRVGGKYRISMEDDDRVLTFFGIYKEIVPNEKLAFTHAWEEPETVETLVTVEFKDKNGGTQVTVTHEGFVDPEQAKSHEEGWTSTLQHLAKQFS